LLYADDILLIAPSVTALQTILTACEHELLHLDMGINEKKIRVHPMWPTPQLGMCDIKVRPRGRAVATCNGHPNAGS